MKYAIIAAGEGSRLKQEGINAPKPLVCLDGITILDRLISIFRSRPDCEEISVVISPEVASQASEIKADNVVVASTPGSMYSLAKLAPHLRGGGHFCLTTVDTIFRRDEFDRYIDSSLADIDHDGHMAVTSYVDDEKPLYVATGDCDNITGFFDCPAEGIRYASAGIYILPEETFDILNECMDSGLTRMRDLQRSLLASGLRLKAHPLSKVIDIDHATDIPKALRLLHDSEK